MRKSKVREPDLAPSFENITVSRSRCIELIDVDGAPLPEHVVDLTRLLNDGWRVTSATVVLTLTERETRVLP